MMFLLKFKNFFLIAFSCSFLSITIGCDQEKRETLFTLLKPNETGITFQNKLSFDDSLNILDFEYMFNGGGVAILDANIDGLPDIYFTGNQVSNRLYINKGNFSFEDKTDFSNTSSTGWSNGVSITDINQDNLPDIYVCKGGPRGSSTKDMANLLFVNNGDGTFSEEAKKYKIDDAGYSIQAIFFDYNKDGHKDLYVLTNALVAFNRNNSRPKKQNGEAASTDRLYKNNGDGTFTNVSHEAGILIEGFGLGVSICDINNDGWLDIYVSNDFLTNDILYINNSDGTFTNKIGNYIRHQSYNGMGLDIADINNDMLSDIIVLDMLPKDNARLKQTVGYFSYDKFVLNTQYGYQPQFVRNTLQINNGNGSFSEIGQLSGIHNTDWSWAPLIADFNNDGWKDIYITNGYRRDVTNLDFINYGRESSKMGTREAIKKQKLDKLKTLPEVKLSNYMFENDKTLRFNSVSKDWGLYHPSYSNGAAYADLDNDGDLDIIVNNIDDPAFIFENNTTKVKKDTLISNNYLRIQLKGNINPEGTQVFLYDSTSIQHQIFSTTRGYLSSVENRIHFGLGKSSKIDSVKIIWPDEKSQILTNINANQELEAQYASAVLPKASFKNTQAPIFVKTHDSLGITYMHTEDEYVDFKKQPLVQQMHSRLGPGMAVGDINGDQLEDFFVGNASGKSGSFFIQQRDHSFIEQKLDIDINSDDMGSLLLDIDNDNDLDLVIVGGGITNTSKVDTYNTTLYLNNGQGHFTEKEKHNNSASGSVITAADYDRDGDLDFFIGNRISPGEYPKTSSSVLLKNQNGNFINTTQEDFDGEMPFGMVSAAIWTDFDNDHWIDLIVTGEFMEIKFFKNYKGKLKDISKNTGLKHTSGWWNSIIAGDFDTDGDMDYIVGNLGYNSNLIASPSEPVTLYAKDFDNNGSIDPILTCYREGTEQIIYSRDLLIQQINAMRGRFKTFESYATTSFQNSFLPKEIKNSQILKANNFSTSYFENLGNGKFDQKPLPIQAQFAPVYGMLTDDVNHDNNLDVILTGNMYSTEVLTGQYDAFTGLVLLGDGNGNFKVTPSYKSGLAIMGDAKSATKLTLQNNTKLYLFSQNSGKLQSYTLSKKNKKQITVTPKNNEYYAIVYRKNKSRYRHEFHYGDGYLSQSTRHLQLNKTIVDSIKLVSYQGKERILRFNTSNLP
ncbi:VCBS repeat-containing protein [Aquimarina pacifica]|uniref:VCBS repeat-containing protein n=1 Tax=Aquimarina pacifica TaxID=1296415 RepID=UPI0004AEB6E5|nr:VCBS repeat-containing protein [Aquimarina pacifica]